MLALCRYYNRRWKGDFFINREHSRHRFTTPSFTQTIYFQRFQRSLMISSFNSFSTKAGECEEKKRSYPTRETNKRTRNRKSYRLEETIAASTRFDQKGVTNNLHTILSDNWNRSHGDENKPSSNEWHPSSNTSISSGRKAWNSNIYHRMDPALASFYKKINKCATIDQTMEVSNEFINLLSLRATDAAWKHLLHLLSTASTDSNDDKPTKSDERLQHQLNALLNHTLIQIKQSDPVGLSDIAQTLASIIKTLHNDRNRLQRLKDINVSHQQMLYDSINENNVILWEAIHIRSIILMDRFRPKWLVSIAWAFATVNTVSKNSSDLSSFFQAVLERFPRMKEDFSSKHMSTLAWSCITCQVKNSELLDEISNEFTTRRKRERNGTTNEIEALDQVTLNQFANSFAKAGHTDPKLFQSISDAATPILGSFTFRSLANLTYAFARAGANPTTKDGSNAFDTIAKQCIPQISNASAQNMSNILWAFATIGHPNLTLFDAIASEASGRLHEFSPQQLANTAWSLSKFQPSSMKIFDHIAQEVALRNSHSFDVQGLAMLAHSFATVGHISNHEFWDFIDNAAAARYSQFKAMECSRLAWSFATIQRPAKELFHGIEHASISDMDSFNTQGLSNLCWAFSLLGYNSPSLFDTIAEVSLLKMNEFKPQEKAMLILALSKTDQSFLNVFEKVASHSLSQLSTFSDLDLFNIVVSYAKVDYQDHVWMKAIADEFIRRSSIFNEHQLVGVAWAFATLKCRSPALLDKIAAIAIKQCSSFDGQEIASLAWSLSSLNYFHRELFIALAESSNKISLHDFNSQSLANIAWAYATAKVAQQLLFDKIANEAIKKQEAFSSQSVSNLLWSFASTGNLHKQLFLSMEQKAVLLLDECSSQSLSNLAWAYSVANIETLHLFDQDSKFVDVCVQKMDEFDDEGLCQLHQWNLWRKELKSNVTLPPAFAQRCFKKFSGRLTHNSKLQSDVISELITMGLHPEEEAHTQSGYRLDAIVEIGEKKIGVEVDGPSHFIGRDPMGSTILKHRQVPHLDGIPIVSLPYWEWNESQTQKDKQDYLLKKLSNRFL